MHANLKKGKKTHHLGETQKARTGENQIIYQFKVKSAGR